MPGDGRTCAAGERMEQQNTDKEASAKGEVKEQE